MKTRKIEILAHIICWALIICSPFLWTRGDSPMTAERFARFAGMPVITAIIFYLNYLWVVPKILLKQKTIRYFVVNTVIIVGGIAGIEQWERTIPHERQETVSTHHKPYPRPHQHRHMPPPVIGFFRFQCFVTFMLGAGLAAAIRSTQHWRQTEEKRKEAELGKVEAELKNLRNQINPHFLLNTLNNIYALTAFDTAKAQKAIMELSKMMRHLLYDNQQQFVAIDKEINFLKNYIELMRIRQNDNVEIEFDTHISEHSNKEIAPLILISLVENAFKHGVSPTEHSCISINIREEKDCIECNITNTNFPKTKDDKSGSGIGLEQVRRRLAILYPDHHHWKYGTDKDQRHYTSHLILYTQKEKKNV